MAPVPETAKLRSMCLFVGGKGERERGREGGRVGECMMGRKDGGNGDQQ